MQNSNSQHLVCTNHLEALLKHLPLFFQVFDLDGSSKFTFVRSSQMFQFASSAMKNYLNLSDLRQMCYLAILEVRKVRSLWGLKIKVFSFWNLQGMIRFPGFFFQLLEAICIAQFVAPSYFFLTLKPLTLLPLSLLKTLVITFGPLWIIQDHLLILRPLT